MSLSRIGLGGALWLVEPRPLPLLALMGAAALSDLLDGWMARRARGGAPPPPGGGRGAWLDPLCDKAFVLSFVAR
ncbi:MAG TPA: CDP-alcohol phosphatidyltransferase family protein, partial [Polyangiaceae bacterium]|nr:CDP-alcohol phosphatidyltransferase family protein [Polyangiaceae bacterium]